MVWLSDQLQTVVNSSNDHAITVLLQYFTKP